MSKVYENGKLGIVYLDNFKERGKKVCEHLKKMRGLDSIDEIIIPASSPRFANGEGKVVLTESVRDRDIYIISDTSNYGCTYRMFDQEHYMSPDEHYQDILRTISAIGGKAKRLTVFMPLLYSSRQHRRMARESLDCALALRQLESLGVKTTVTLDAHDPNVQNATPNGSFETIFPTYPILKEFIKNEKENINKEQMLVVSPDTGAMARAILYASMLGLEVGMFYKRRDYSKLVNGKNPIIQHDYVGGEIEGKDILIIDDMIASGGSVIDICEQLKLRKARNIFVITSFAFFTEGLDAFDKLYEEGKLKALYSTNACYISDKLKQAKWFHEIDVCELIAQIIDTLNSGESIGPLINSEVQIKNLLSRSKL